MNEVLLLFLKDKLRLMCESENNSITSGTVVDRTGDKFTTRIKVIAFDLQKYNLAEDRRNAEEFWINSRSIVSIGDEIVLLYRKELDKNYIVEYTLTPPTSVKYIKHYVKVEGIDYGYVIQSIGKFSDLCMNFRGLPNSIPYNIQLKMIQLWKKKYILRCLRMYNVSRDCLMTSMMNFSSLIDALRCNPWKILSIPLSKVEEIVTSTGIDFISIKDGRRIRKFLEVLVKNYGVIDRNDDLVPLNLVNKYYEEFDLEVQKDIIYINGKVVPNLNPKIKCKAISSRNVSLKRITEEKEEYSCEKSVIDRILNDLKQKSLNEQQISGVRNALIYRNSILTGGAGVGKTKTVSEIISVMTKLNKKGLLCSFTGKAVARMREMALAVIKGDKIKAEFSTIHKIIISPYENISKFDYVIIDEISMVSEEMLVNLFEKSYIFDSKKIFVGDVNQLEPIEGRNILSFIEKKKINTPITTLNINYRSDKSILAVTDAILMGTKVQFNENVIHKPNISREEVVDLSESYKGDMQIITPFCKEQEVLLKLIKKNKNVDKYGFFFGERLRVCQNLYEEGRFILATGESGIYLGERDGQKPKVAMESGEIHDLYVKSEEKDIFLFDSAEVMTIHKVQGSEFNNIILWNPKSSSFVSKKMMYTALTRARKTIVIAGYMPIFEEDEESYVYDDIDFIDLGDISDLD